MSQARAVWKRITRILIREGVEPRVSGFFFKSVIQAVLLLRLETWVVNTRKGRALWGVPAPGGETADGAATVAET